MQISMPPVRPPTVDNQHVRTEWIEPVGVCVSWTLNRGIIGLLVLSTGMITRGHRLNQSQTLKTKLG